MNEMNTNPPLLPPQPASPGAWPPPPPPPPTEPGADPAERQPIEGIAAGIEAILRQPRRVMYALRQGNGGRLIAGMLLVAMVCAGIYGVVVGSFSGGVQYWQAPLKIIGGMFVAAIICLPSLYIFACLSGSQARLIEMAGLVAGMLLLTTLLLIGFAPVAWLFSESTRSLCWMGALHLIFWGIAAAFGLHFLGSGFAATKARSQAGLRVWAVIFMLVALQMTTALRPILGTAPTVLPTEKKFFIKHWLDCLEETPPLPVHTQQNGRPVN